MQYGQNAIAAGYDMGIEAQKHYAGAALGGIAGQIKGAEPPRTLSSAASKLDSLNERLAKATESLSMIAGQIGALASIGVPASSNQPAANGAVGRLNESADSAHLKISEIEQLIAGIGRSLG